MILRRTRARVAELEARMEALEGARPTVELVEWSKVPDQEPVDALALWRTLTADYSYGYDAGEDWRLPGYL